MIEDYAWIGDTHSGALISRAGSIDWLCLPRFDSPACFAALLDAERGGSWSLAPDGETEATERAYVDDTLVLRTTYRTATGAVTVTDCLALEPRSDPERPRLVLPEEVLVRVVECTEGTVAMTSSFRPRFDYGEVVPWFRERDGYVEAIGGPDALDLSAPVPLEVSADGISSRFEITAGDVVPFIMSYRPSHLEWKPRRTDECATLVANSVDFWRSWTARCTYDGERRDDMIRSLLTLKSLTFSPTGGVVAAPTTSLPEEIGGERNWDYRYCWLRDATFTLDVFLEHGYTEEAREWRDWLLRSVAGEPHDMQIMYGVRGERRLIETELPLAGYEGSRPVRIGNAAHDQFQLDVYGEVMDSFHSARRAGIETPPHAWDLERAIVDFVCDHWQDPDEGIWEVRSGREHFVHSKVMAWVAVDRGISAVEHFGEDGPLDKWRAVREQIRDDVMARGVNEVRGCFKRSYTDDSLDAALLMFPFVGFIDVNDEVMVNTIEAVRDDLMVDGLVHRYRTDEAADGLPGGEGTFLMCSFWYVDCLVLLGRLEEADALYRNLVATANDLSLLAEQYDPKAGRLLGNFPQAFSHVALVTSALALDTAGVSRPIHRGEHR